MFLFDRERTGRSPFTLGQRTSPELVWEVSLKQYPPMAPESTPVMDGQGNLYFGCHDGVIYCLGPDGTTKWQFTTDDKVYASPLLVGDRLIVTCNKADVVCLRLDGTLDWVYNGFKEQGQLPRMKRIVGNLFSYWRYDYEFRKYMKINAWGSPNLLQGSLVVVTLYGLGVVALELVTGKPAWVCDLGLPYNHLAGVAVTSWAGSDHIAAVSQSNGLFWIDAKGRIVWRSKLKRGYNSWSNPSIDREEEAIYCATSTVNTRAVVYKFNFKGDRLWVREVRGGIRGSISIGAGDTVLVPGMQGSLFFLSKKDGSVTRTVKIASADRGLWTSACIDPAGDILINTKLGQHKGSLIRLSPQGEKRWEINYGKALSVPVIDAEGNVYTGTWEGKFLKYMS